MHTEANSMVTREVTCANGMPAYVAHLSEGGPFPIVILLHERYGLVDHARELARRAARDGFFVIAPSLFFKHPDQESLNAGSSRYDMTDPESVEYLKVALETAKATGCADTSRVAVAGYCQTGRHPLIFAAEVPIAAAVVWYGAAAKREWLVDAKQPKALAEVIAGIDCPVFGAFGEKDHIISVDDVRHFRDALEDGRKGYEIHLYANAPHGWLNDTMPGRYCEEQAKAAWAAQQRFLTRIFTEKKREQVVWKFTSEIGPDYDFSKNKRLE